MRFNLLKHLIDHPFWVLNFMMIKQIELVSTKHFNTSCHIAFFIQGGHDTQNKIDDVMYKIATNLVSKTYTFQEKSYIYTDRFGITTQKYRQRKISFKDLFFVYHNEHFDRSKDVNPHYHFLITKDVRTGKGYTYLRKALSHEAKKFGIKFHFEEKKQLSSLSRNQLMNLKRLSWNLQQIDDDVLANLLIDTNKMTQYIDLLVQHNQETNNISYFFKIIQNLHNKLFEFNIDFIYEDVNLKNNMLVYFDYESLGLISRLQNFEDIELNLSVEFDRLILKYAHGFDSIVMDFIIEKFDIYQIKKSQIIIVDDSDNDDIGGESELTAKTIPFKQLVVQDIRNAVAYAKNEKEVKSLLIQSGEYNKITTKTRKKSDGKREKIGFEVITSKKTKLFLPWYELGISHHRLEKVFKHNVKRNKEKKSIKSDLSGYKKRKVIKKDKKFKKFVFKMQSLLQFIPLENTLNKVECIDLNLKGNYEVSRSDLYDITTYKNEKSMFVNYGDNITLKKAPINTSVIINDMLDVAVEKGWNIELMQTKGQKAFTRKAKEIISNRMGKNKENNQSLQPKM